MSDTHAHADDHHAKAAASEAPIGPRRLLSETSDGGHEIDRPPNFVLFGFLGLTAVILVVSAIGVFQLFAGATSAKAEEAANRPIPQRVAQDARDQDFHDHFGIVPPATAGEPETLRMPIVDAARLVLQNNSRFSAAAPPAGWVHPDDAVAAPAPTKAP